MGPIGDIPILISGDFSELEKDIQQAETIAERGGKEIADALVAGASTGADVGEVFSESLRALEATAKEAGASITEAFGAAAGGVREYSTDAEALIEKQKELDIELANAYGTLAEIKNAFEDGAVSADVLTRAENDVTEALNRAHPALRETKQAEEELEHETVSLIEQLTAFGEALIITEGLKEFGQEALTAYGAIQKTEIALKSLTGDTKENVHELVDRLKEMAVELGLDAHALENMQVRLAAFGVEESKIPDIMHATAEAAAATNKEFDAVASAIERTALSGMVSSRQLVQLGLNMGDLAKAMDMVGESDKAIRNAFKDLTVNERIETLTKTLSKFGTVAEEVAQGISAQWQDVKTRLEDVFEAIGQALAPIVGEVLKTLSEDVLPAIQHMVEAFGELPEPVKDFAVTVGLAVAALAPLAAGLAAFGLAASALSGVLPALTGLLATFGVEFTGIGAAAATAGPMIVAIGAALATLHFSEVDEAALEFAKTLRDSFGGLVDLITPGKDAIKALKDELGPLGVVLDIVDAAFEHIKASGITVRDVIDAILPGLKLLREGLVTAASALEYLSGNYKSMGEASKLVMQNLEDHNREFINSLRDSTEEQRKGIDVIKEHTMTKKELAAATKEAAAAEALFIDQIGKVRAFIGPLTEDQAQLNQYMQEGATAIEHVRTAADDLADSSLADFYASIVPQIVETNSDFEQMSQYIDDAAHSVIQLRDATADLADSDQLKQYFEDSSGIVDNVIHETDAYRVDIKGVGDDWESTGRRAKSTAQDLSNVISRDLAGTLKDVLFNISNIGKDFQKLGADIVDTVLNHIIKLALKPLMDNLDQILAKIPGLGGLAGGGVTGGGGKSGGGGSSGGVGSALGIASLGVDIASGITQGIQMAHLNNLMGEVEVSTRGTLNQLISIQGTLNTYFPEILHLVDIWAEIIVTNDILRLMAQNGGGFGGGGADNGVTNSNFGQEIADVINANPSNGGANSIAAVTQDYTVALQTTASTAYTLNEAVLNTTSSLVALNTATQQVNGSLPGIADGIDRTLFNAMTGNSQNLSPGGPRSNATPFIMPVPSSGFTGPAAFTQGAMLPNVNNPIQYSSVAPSVGGPGVGAGGGASFGSKSSVAVYAVDPSGRQIANATVKGLEQIGVRTR